MSSRIALLMTLALGCGPAVSTDDTGGSAPDDSGTGTDTTAGTATTASTGTAAETTASTSPGTSPDPTAGTTAVPSTCASDYVTGCQSYCAATITCDPESGEYEACVTSCAADIARESVECQTQYCEALSCYGALDCVSLETNSPECDALAEKTDEVCEGGGSKCLIGAGSDGTSCSYTCGGEIVQRVSCEGGSCVCYEDDVQIAECPADDICANLDAIEEYASACCGW